MASENNTPRLEITTRIGCKMNCVYCPQNTLTKRYRGRQDGRDHPIEMTLEVFKACLGKLPRNTRIDFSGMCEAWLNPHCTDMVLYAHEQGFKIVVYTTLVGMTSVDLERIAHIPFEEFVLHIPDDASNAHIDVTPEYIALLEEVVGMKRGGVPVVTGYSCHAGLHPDIKGCISDDSVLITEMNDRAGNVDQPNAPHVSPNGESICINCGWEIHHNVLLPDGTVLLCCMDYGMKHILGNLLEETWEEIHNSAEAKKVKEGFCKADADTLCRGCVNAVEMDVLFEHYALFRKWARDLHRSEKALTADLAVYRSWVERLENHSTWLQSQVGELEARAANLRNEKFDLEENIRRLVDEGVCLNAKIDLLRDQVNDLKNAEKAKNAKLKKNEQYISMLEGSKTFKIMRLMGKITGH